MKLRLVRNWRQARSWYSTHSMALSVSLLGAWAALPDRMQEAFSPLELKCAAIVLIVLGIVGRLIDQGGEDD